jgi:hypothetical protein
VSVTAYASGTLTTAFGTFTVTIASPAVFSKTGHGLSIGDTVTFSTTGALPTGLTAGTTYYVISGGLTANAFEVSATLGGSAVNTTGSQSGTHTVTAEQFLSSPNVAGTFLLVYDTVNMAAGDTLESRGYQMVLTGGTSRVVYPPSPAWVDAQTGDEIKILGPIVNELTDTNAVRFSLRQTAGASHTFPWKVLMV